MKSPSYIKHEKLAETQGNNWKIIEYQSSLTVYRATPIPMPQPEPKLAMK